MFAPGEKQLHWSQRIALVRHNFHSARRTGDFTFFKAIQAHAFVQGTDYVATLTTALGGDADAVLSTLDGLNAALAYVFQDAFKSVYDGLKSHTMGQYDEDVESAKARIGVDVSQQMQRADFAMDRIINSAMALIQLQPAEYQSEVACAWVLGATIISDAISVCMRELRSITDYIGDFIRLENSWSDVQASTEAATTALRGILNLMATDESAEDFRRYSTASNGSAPGTGPMGMLRKFSTVLGTSFSSPQPPPPPYKKYRGGSTASCGGTGSVSSQSSPSMLRYSFANAVPTKMPKTPRSSVSTTGSSNGDYHPPAPLATIPGTPGGVVNEGFNFDMPPSPYSGDEKAGITGEDRYVRPKIEMVDPLHVSA